MNLQPLIFYIISSFAVLAALAVVGLRSALASGFCMIGFSIASAGLFLLMQAPFIAVLYTLVYAGAVMVLFIFITMLVETPKAVKRTLNLGKVASLMSLSGAFGWIVYKVAYCAHYNTDRYADLQLGAGVHQISIKEIGYLLLTKYMLPVQIIAFLLFMAMIGTVMFSKDETIDIKPDTMNANNSTFI